MNDLAPPKFGLGAPVRRVEDASLITGTGRYTDDIAPEGTLAALFVRSAVGHGRFTVGDLAAARAVAGVRLVWTHADLGDVGNLVTAVFLKQPDGSMPEAPPHPILAKGTVRHVGEPIALVVADTLDAAKSAAELIDIGYETLPVAIDLKEAASDGAPLVWPERPGNVGYDFRAGDAAAAEAAFAQAARVTKIEIVNNRLVANYMEPRSVIAEYDGAADRYTLTLGTQGGHGLRNIVTERILGIDKAKMRIVTPDVGGGFGPKTFVYHEYPVAALAAKALGRPVKWVSDRTEHFLSCAQGRDHVSTAEMAMDGEGRFLAMRVDVLANLGAYVGQFGGFIAAGGASMTTGVYDIPALDLRVRGVFTNTVPTDAYRGAGRPEAAYLLDRLVEQCGRETGLGPVEIRRRNFIAPAKLPYKTQGGREYDSGDFAGHLDRAVAESDRDGFAARREESRRRGKLRGYGLCTYIEACAFPGEEPATLRLETDGTVTLLIGTQTNGQGHATAYTQFVVGHLGIGYDKVKVVQGDTDQVPTGGGTGGSRSIPLGAVSVDRAAIALAAKLKELAAQRLEASAADLEFAEGRIRVAGTDRAVSLAEIAAGAEPEAVTSVEAWRQPAPTYPNGTHACEVEIDPDTGEAEVVRYTIVDDVGVAVNPILLAGQVHGGTVQGIGQALYERTVYDEDGQLLTASFLDYCLPRAENVPDIGFQMHNVPCKTNAFGIKGAGEAGSVGSCAAVINAVIDALAEPYGVTHIDMPATPGRVWAAMRGEAA